MGTELRRQKVVSNPPHPARRLADHTPKYGGEVGESSSRVRGVFCLSSSVFSRVTVFVRRYIAMFVTVLLFAKLRELAGGETLRIELPEGSTVADLRATIAATYPALATLLAKSAIAVNQDFASDTLILKPTDEIALIPPVSGG
jgi:molybdopterin converting factor subunit 1